jgi:hypothetical protein
MNARKAAPLTSGWVKLAAALILLAGMLLGGILAAPEPLSVQAINAPSQADVSREAISNGVKGTLASFTALIPQNFMTNLPFLTR